MQALPGFRDFYPADAAVRNAVVGAWRRVALGYGFEEYDGPMLEPLDLYAKKNAGGEEILGQLYRFEDGGGRAVALRPEMTPTLARMAAAKEKHFRKPMKWFATGSFFRYERQQRGRLREFLQFNCDLLGEAGPAADAEIIALAIDTLRTYSLGAGDFVVRLSHRGAWIAYLESRGITGETASGVLRVADKLERETDESLDAKLAPLTGDRLCAADLRAFVAGTTPAELEPVMRDLAARGLADFVKVDLTIVRGLAYYTGTIFEIFDRAGTFRALAGGGRYDGLVGSLTGTGSPMPAVGFGMGDAVLCEMIASLPHSAKALEDAVQAARARDVYVVIADEAHRPWALGLLQSLRDAGLKSEVSLSPTKVGKQFQAAEQAGCTHAVVVGGEWPMVRLKTLATRVEEEISHDALAARLKNQQV